VEESEKKPLFFLLLVLTAGKVISASKLGWDFFVALGQKNPKKIS
jgi:hypothetical protein